MLTGLFGVLHWGATVSQWILYTSLSSALPGMRNQADFRGAPQRLSGKYVELCTFETAILTRLKTDPVQIQMSIYFHLEKQLERRRIY